MITMSFRQVVSAGNRFINKWKNKSGIFYSCVKWPLLCYRCFCVFPITKSENDDDNFTFKWSSPYFIFISIPLVTFQIVTASFYFFDTFSIGFNFRTLSLTINYTVGCISSLLVMRLSRNFKKMYNKIVAIETNLPPVRKNSRLVNSLPLITVVGICLSFFYCFLNVNYLFYMAIHCTPQNDDIPLKTYLKMVFVSIFRHIDFSYIAAVIFQIIKFQVMMFGTFNNLFTICCSAYLENRFNNLNNIILAGQKNAVSMDWPKIQEHYVQLTKLVKIIDKRINPIVFMSYFIDLYNLCLQCYYVVRQSYYYLVHYSDCIKSQHVLQTKYYKPYSALFTLTKMISVSLVCARLNTASRRPLSCLHTVSRAAYNQDAHRFMEQVYHSKIALSGFQFFYITKEMIITVLGILVTYELVLIQLIT